MSEVSPDLTQPNTRRAFRLGIANGIFFAFGMAFVDPVSVLPTFVSRLTDSEFVVGLVSAIGMSGWFLPQLVAANYLQSRPYKRPLYIVSAMFRGAGWLFAIPLVYLLAPRHPVAALVAFLVCYSFSSFGGGFSGPAFLDIVAKTIPHNRLGAFFGHRQFWGGLGAMLCGLLVGRILAADSLVFPYNYCLLFGLALAFFAPGWIAFTFIKEPPGRVTEAQPFVTFMLNAPSVIRRHRDYRLLLISRLFLGASGIALPFYIIYCRRFLGISEAGVGTYLSLQMAGSVIFVPLWTYLNDRKGPRQLLIATAALSLTGPVLALLATFSPQAVSLGRIGFGLVFFSLAAVGAGSFIGFTNYLFAIAPEEKRPLYIGVQNTLFALTTLMPPLGGLLVASTSFRVLFGLATVFSLAGAVTILRLPHGSRGESEG